MAPVSPSCVHHGQTPDFPGPWPASAGSSRSCFLWKPLRLSAGRACMHACVCAQPRLTTRATCSDPQVSRSACLMTTQLICKLLRSREAAAAVDVRAWPPILDTGQSSHPPDAWHLRFRSALCANSPALPCRRLAKEAAGPDLQTFQPGHAGLSRLQRVHDWDASRSEGESDVCLAREHLAGRPCAGGLAGWGAGDEEQGAHISSKL